MTPLKNSLISEAMIKIFVLAVVSSLISILLKQNAKEFVLPFQLSVGTVILIFLLKESSESLKEITDIINSYPEEKKLLFSMAKAGIIAIITKLSCDICHEGGNLFIEDIIEFGGRIMIFVISLPYIVQILKVAVSFID